MKSYQILKRTRQCRLSCCNHSKSHRIHAAFHYSIWCLLIFIQWRAIWCTYISISPYNSYLLRHEYKPQLWASQSITGIITATCQACHSQASESQLVCKPNTTISTHCGRDKWLIFAGDILKYIFLNKKIYSDSNVSEFVPMGETDDK